MPAEGYDEMAKGRKGGKGGMSINTYSQAQAQMMSRAKGTQLDVENKTYSDSHFEYEVVMLKGWV
jgi:hypothetical protein